MSITSDSSIVNDKTHRGPMLDIKDKAKRSIGEMNLIIISIILFQVIMQPHYIFFAY